MKTTHIFYVYAYAKESDCFYEKGQRVARYTYHAKDKAEAITKMKQRWNPECFTFKAVQGKGIDEANLQFNQKRRMAAKRQKIENDVYKFLQYRYKKIGAMYNECDLGLLMDYVIYKEGL